MSLKKSLRQLIKKAVFAGERLPNRIFLAQAEPQQEVVVWLIGLGEPIDVTRRHCQASALPFTICIEFARGQVPNESLRSRLKLRLCEKGGACRVLSELDLDYQETLECGESKFLLFHSSRSVNYCLPWRRLWSHHLWQTYVTSRKGAKVRVPAAQWHAMAALFCCPRPVSLISVADQEGNGNIYPLNVMGDLNRGYFGFCLKHNYLPEKFVQQNMRVVLSSVPMKQAPIAYLLGPNHNRPTIDWKQLPFATRPSQTLRIPVPLFACRVRELQVERVHRLGYHTFFLARVLSDEQLLNVPELCVAHGFYQEWRVKNREVDKLQAAAEDLYVRAPLSREAAERISASSDRMDDISKLCIGEPSSMPTQAAAGVRHG
jgi:flavin reductase (DIM6/NTAB) family NADH-FMN oxidoreductase RutF